MPKHTRAGKKSARKPAVRKPLKKAAKPAKAGKTARTVRSGAKPPARKSGRAAKPAGRGIGAQVFQGLSLREIAARVSSHLEELGYDPALTGKSAAAIYVGPSLKPRALDFVLREYTVNELAKDMQQIGFKGTEDNTFESSRCPLVVVFSPPPLSVGDDVIEHLNVVKTREGVIHTLSPTDCVRQRLSMYYRWGDREALEDAVAVARKQAIDLEKVRRWSEWEWAIDRYEDFVKALKESSKLKAQS